MFIEILFKMLLFKGGVLIYTEHCISALCKLIQDKLIECCNKAITCKYIIYTIYIYIYIYIHIHNVVHIYINK